MQSDIINVGLAFLEGLGLIVSPCILPILPLILAGSLEGSKRRPIGIIVGFVVIFALFTFFSRQLVRYTGIDLGLVRNISFILLILFGLIMLSTSLTEKFALLTRRLANVGSRLSITNTQNGFIGGVVFGSLIGLVWTPCAGPILAAVIVQTVIQQTTFGSFLTVLAFGIGAGVPMLIIALFGRVIVEKFTFLKEKAELFRKILGAIIIATVLYMIYSDNFAVSFAGSLKQPVHQDKIINGVSNPYPAPAIEDISAWINSSPLKLSDLKGKVVLIDFWTYSCINCVRTLPYLVDWYNKYNHKGLVIIGVHTPEFEFEKDVNNVKNAVKTYGIKYPVALDNNFVTWQNFENRYWPAHYLIDKNGNVVYQHFGEGGYDITENNIRYLLGMNATSAKSLVPVQENINRLETPETYLGYARAGNYSQHEKMVRNHANEYTFPGTLAQNEWALEGRWIVNTDRIIALQANAALKIHFNARKVFVVMGNTTNSPIDVKVLLNGSVLQNEKGKDVSGSSIKVDKHALYEVMVLDHVSSGVLELIASAPGLEVYTFTFGS